MSSLQTLPDGSIQVDTDDWTVVWANGTLDLTCKRGGKKHTRLCGDPHIFTDGGPEMDFPSPTCSFVLSDGSIVVADAPAPNQQLNDVHVFTSDEKHYALGASKPFDDVIGTVFAQGDDGSFYGLVSRDVGTTNPNPVRKTYTDVT